MVVSIRGGEDTRVHYVRDHRDILDMTPVMFGTIKDGIMKLLDDRLGVFRAEITAG